MMRSRCSLPKIILMKLLARAGLLKHLSFCIKVKRGKKIIKIPILGEIGYENLYEYEHWMDKIMPILLGCRQGVVVDVGVNLGQTLLKFLECENGHEYVGFEPNPHCFAYADKIIEVNHLKCVTLVPVGLSNETALLKLYLHNDCDAAATVVSRTDSRGDYAGFKHVAVFKGDDAARHLGIRSISVLKIDVEGAELEVLTGLEDTINNLRPVVICEILPVPETASAEGAAKQKKTESVLHFFSKAGYRMSRIEDDGGITALRTIDAHEDIALRNYLFLPDESAEGILEQLKRNSDKKNQ